MTNANDLINPTVFPWFTYGDGSSEPPSAKGGLTKREYFTAKQMAAARVSSPALPSEMLAEQAVMDADAIIEALNKQP